MQRSRIYLLLALNTAIVYGAVVLLLPGGGFQQWAFIGVAMLLVMVAPAIIVDREFGALGKELALKDTEIDKIKRDLLAMRRQLQEAATLDDVTGAFNRRHYENLVDHHRGLAERGGHNFAVCATRMDNFGGLLETFGDEKGDDVLRLIASIVKSALREVDIVARTGPDQFGIILSGANEDESVSVVDRIGELISQIQISDEKPDFRLTASTGISGFRATVTVDDMLQEAEQALAFAIDQGGNRVAAHLAAPSSEVG